MKHRTGSSNQAAALLSQLEFPVTYAGLEPTKYPNTVKFVLEYEVDEGTLNAWLLKYNNQQALVEPTKYDHKFKMLISQSKEQQT